MWIFVLFINFIYSVYIYRIGRNIIGFRSLYEILEVIPKSYEEAPTRSFRSLYEIPNIKSNISLAIFS